MEFNEFRDAIKKVKGKRKSKITGSFGVRDVYKYIRRNKWFSIPKPITEGEFYAIIRSMNNLFVEELLKGNDVTFPYRMGKLELRKYSPEYKFKDGKLISVLPINWDKTLKEWYNNPELKEQKLVIYDTPKEIFRVVYNCHNKGYTNKSFFKFRIMRNLKIKLKDKIQEGSIDAYIYK